MIKGNFSRRATLVSLAFLPPLAVTAQDLDFSSEPTETCLARAERMTDRLLCIGLSAQACIDTPDGYTTVGMGFCYGYEAGYWDDRLNVAFATLMTSERDLVAEMAEIGARMPDAPGALRDMQRAWIGYRDALCGYEYTTWGGGTGGGPAHSACLMHETGRQALLLETRLKERQQ